MVATAKPTITVLDPTAPPIPVHARMAKRPGTLTGKRLGLLDNHKKNAAEFLDHLQELLSERYEFASVVKRTKPDVSRPAPDEMLKELVEGCDLVITGMGD